MPPRSPLGIITACLIFAVALPASAQASESAAFLQDYFERIRDLGATRLDHGPIEDDPATRTATVSDIAVDLPIALNFGVAGTFSMDILWRQPSFTVVNARRTGKGYEIEHAEMPGTAAISVSLPGDDTFRATGSVVNWQGDGLYWPDLPTIAADPDRPISRYYPLLRWIANMEAERSSIESLTVDQTGPGDTTQKTVYEDIVVTDQKQGVIGSTRIGRMVAHTTQILPSPQMPNTKQDTPNTPAAGTSTMEMTYEVGSVTYRNYDFGRIVFLLDPETHAINKADRALYPVIDEAWANTITGNLDGMTVSVGRYGGTGFAMRRPDVNILAVADRMAKGEVVPEIEALHLALSAIGSFAAKTISIDDITYHTPSDTQGSGRLDRIFANDLTPDGIGEIAIEGIHASDPKGISLSLERFGLKDLTFPTARAILDLTAFTQNNPGIDPPVGLVLPVIPTLGEMETRAFSVTKASEGTVSIDRALTRFSGHIGPIPTSVETHLDNFRAPVSIVDDHEAREAFESMGLNEMVLNERLSLAWNEATGDLTLDPLTLELKGAGKLSLAMRITGVPRIVFENPQAAQQALATLAFTSARLDIDNQAFIQSVMRKTAEEEQKSVDDVRDEILVGVSMAVQSLGDPATAEMIENAITSFLKNPRKLTVEAAPEQPLPLTQIMGLAAVAPQAIISQINLMMRASD